MFPTECGLYHTKYFVVFFYTTTAATMKDWKATAIEKYGVDVVEASSHLYAGSYEYMVKDDNVLGAIPTLDLNAPCPWLRNKPGYFFLCLIVQLQFLREENELRLYIDARGERDLRNPKDSSVVRRAGGETANDLAWQGLDQDSDMISGEFVPVVSIPGHHKGYLSFDAGLFAKPGKYYFSFADVRRNEAMRSMMMKFEAMGAPRSMMAMLRDYPEIPLLEVPGEGGLLAAFADADGRIRYTSSSPFEKDTEEVERKRFAPHVEKAVLTRHEEEAPPGGRPKRKWWVGPNDDPKPEPQRVILNII